MLEKTRKIFTILRQTLPSRGLIFVEISNRVFSNAGSKQEILYRKTNVGTLSYSLTIKRSISLKSNGLVDIVRQFGFYDMYCNRFDGSDVNKRMC